MNEFEKNYERLDDFHPHHHHADMNAWAELHRTITDDIDEPFVVHYESGTSVVNCAFLEFDDLHDDYDFPIFFRFVMTTNRLFD